MSRTPKSPTQHSNIRLMSGALTLLLLFGAALLGGAQQSKGSSGFWRATTKAPLADVIAYPKECQLRESRWRHLGEGDDGPQDQPVALDAYPQSALDPQHRCPAAHFESAVFTAFVQYRPQAPRAPPLA